MIWIFDMAWLCPSGELEWAALPAKIQYLQNCWITSTVWISPIFWFLQFGLDKEGGTNRSCLSKYLSFPSLPLSEAAVRVVGWVGEDFSVVFWPTVVRFSLVSGVVITDGSVREIVVLFQKAQLRNCLERAQLLQSPQIPQEWGITC